VLVPDFCVSQPLVSFLRLDCIGEALVLDSLGHEVPCLYSSHTKNAENSRGG